VFLGFGVQVLILAKIFGILPVPAHKRAGKIMASRWIWRAYSPPDESRILVFKKNHLNLI